MKTRRALFLLGLTLVSVLTVAVLSAAMSTAASQEMVYVKPYPTDIPDVPRATPYAQSERENVIGLPSGRAATVAMTVTAGDVLLAMLLFALLVVNLFFTGRGMVHHD